MTNIPFINSISNELSKRKLKSDVVANALLDISMSNDKLDKVLKITSSASEIDNIVSLFLPASNFGLVADGVNDDTAALQLCLNSGKKIRLPSGTIKVTSTLNLISGNSFLSGTEYLGFATTVIKPSEDFIGESLFSINGENVAGGWGFRSCLSNIMIWTPHEYGENLTSIFNIKKSYTIMLEKLWLYQTPKVGITLNGNNNIHLDKIFISGRGNSLAGSIGIDCQSDGSSGGIYINDCDIESVQKCISQKTNSKVFLTNPFFERYGTGWEAIGDETGYFGINGGRFINPSASSSCGNIRGHNVNVFGGSYLDNGGGAIRTSDSPTRFKNINIFGVPNFTPHRNQYPLTKNSSINDDWIELNAYHSKTFQKNTATPFIEVIVPYTPTEGHCLDITLSYRLSTTRRVGTSKFLVSFNNSSTIVVNNIDEYAKSNWENNTELNVTPSILTSISGTSLTLSLLFTLDGTASSNDISIYATSKILMTTSNTSGTVYFNKK